MTGTMWIYKEAQLEDFFGKIIDRFAKAGSLWGLVKVPVYVFIYLIQEALNSDAHQFQNNYNSKKRKKQSFKVFEHPEHNQITTSVASGISLVIFPHFNITNVSESWTEEYRALTLKVAKEVHEKLCQNGYFIIGVKDARVRSEDKFKLIPLSMLVWEDINFQGLFKLKEFFVAVPDGYSCQQGDEKELHSRLKKNESKWMKECDADEFDIFEREPLPIVHFHYLVFIKQ